MEYLINNYSEFLASVREHANRYINDDVKFWDSYVNQRIGEIGVEAKLGENFEVETLKTFESNDNRAYYSKFAVTGVNTDEDGESYITKVHFL